MGLLYQKRRLKVNKIKRQIAATRTMLMRFRVLLSLVMIVCICFCSYKILKLPYWYIDPQKLAKADPSVLKIQGNKITPDYKIINMVRQTQLPYTQIFRLDTKELEDNIAQLQPVKKVYVRRYWFPARLTIIIDERTPAFLLAPNLDSEPNSALSTDGVLIDHDYLPFDSSIKAKKLLTYGVRDGKDEVWDKKRVDEILKLTKVIETYSGQEVQYIDLRNQKDVYIMLKEYLIRFGEINDTALKRAISIASILPQAKNFGQKIKYIDLRWEDSHYFRLEGQKDVQNQSKILQAKKEENKIDKEPKQDNKDINKEQNNQNNQQEKQVETQQTGEQQ